MSSNLPALPVAGLLATLILLSACAGARGDASSAPPDDSDKVAAEPMSGPGVNANTGLETTSREPAVVDVLTYRLRLSVEPDGPSIDGHADIDLDVATGNLLVLDLAGLAVDTVWVDGRPAGFDRDGETVTVTTGSSGRHTVSVSYGGLPDRGLYTKSVDGNTVVYTDSWPERARGWMPSVDHPSDPAQLELTLDVPAPLEAVASGKETGRWTEGGRNYSSWQATADAPTYTMAFAAADFHFVDTTAVDVPVRYALLEQHKSSAAFLRRTPSVLEFFSDVIGPYAFESYSVVEVPIGFGGMENASSPFLSDNLFDEPSDAGSAESVQVHEAAHMWFGDRVVIQDWRHLWISEGFATYLTALFYEHADGTERARENLIGNASWTPARARSHGPLVPASRVHPNEFLGWLPYQKGASVLHTLRLLIGDEAFLRGLQQIYRNQAGKPTTTDGIKGVFEDTSGRDLTSFFSYWVYGSALPKLTTAFDENSGSLTWTITGARGQLEGVDFELAVRQNGTLTIVPASAGQVQLATEVKPEVFSVGVLLEVVR